MSLILEALKKSEAERRLGQAPGLLSPTLPAPPARRRRAPALALLAAGVLLAGAGGWWLAQRAQAPAEQPRPVTEERTAAQPVNDVAPAGGALPLPPRAGGPQTQPAAAVPAPEAVALAPATAPAPATTRQPAPTQPRPTSPAPAPALPSDPTFASIEREARAMVAGDAVPATPPAGRAPADPSAAVSPAADAAAVPAPARHPPAAVAVPPTPATAAGQPSLEPLPGLRQLPEAVRASLPPLKLSMHVFVEAPDERFVLIDGRRYGEGSALGEGLLVEEIRRDGVVMVRNGTRFLLRRPG